MQTTPGEAHIACVSPTRNRPTGDRVNFRVRVYSLHSVVAEASRLDIVTASIKANRVASFRLWFGGAGD